MFCTCENPLMDVEHDAGCRRCGNPVDFTPRPVTTTSRELVAELELLERYDARHIGARS